MNIIGGMNVKFNDRKIYYTLILVFFCIGIVLGICTIKYMGSTAQSELTNYFTSFLKSMEGNNVEYNKILIDIIKNNIILIGLICLLAFTIIGGPIILLIDLIKGFTLGYTFAFLLTTFDGGGIWLSIGAVLPHNIFYIPAFVGISGLASEISFSKIKDKFVGKGNNKQNKLNELGIKVLAFMMILIIGFLIEAYVTPRIIALILQSLY